MVGGANDGSIHVWQERKVYSKPDLLIRLAHPQGTVVTCVIVSPNGYVVPLHFFRPSNIYNLLHFCLLYKDIFRHKNLIFDFFSKLSVN